MSEPIKFMGEVIIPVGRGHLLIESWTEPGEYHSIDLEEGSCSCRGWECTRGCRHLDVARELAKATQPCRI